MVNACLLCYFSGMSNPVTNFALCSNPRSGTTLLCTLLEATGVAGKPNSFFRQKSLKDWAESWNLTGNIDATDPDFTARYFKAMMKEGRADTPVFGLRLMGPDLEFACDWLRRRHPEVTSDRALFETAFGPLRYVHLVRQDKLAEAISYLRAEQTGLWHQNVDGSPMEHIAPSHEDGFDADAITQRLEMLNAFDIEWHSWFKAQGITPLHLTYEALAHDPQNAVAQVLEHIDQDPDLATDLTPRLRKLADQTSAEWMDRYRRLFPNR